MAIFNEDGSTYQEYAYSAIPQDKLMDTLIQLLKQHRIRLELNSMDVDMTIKALYFY
jgi:hypothetical protein